MTLTFEPLANVRVTSPAAYGSGSEQLEANRRGELMIAPAQLSKTELARLNDSWSCQMATGSAFTFVANMPTTRAELVLFNNHATKSVIIDTAWCFALTSITAASSMTLIYQVASISAPTDDTAQLINSPLGKTYSGSTRRAVAQTTMTANKWAVLACAGAGAAASIGHGVFAEVNGGIILRPAYGLGLNVVVGTATGTGLIGVSWHEATLDVAS